MRVTAAAAVFIVDSTLDADAILLPGSSGEVMAARLTDVGGGWAVANPTAEADCAAATGLEANGTTGLADAVTPGLAEEITAAGILLADATTVGCLGDIETTVVAMIGVEAVTGFAAEVARWLTDAGGFCAAASVLATRARADAKAALSVLAVVLTTCNTVFSWLELAGVAEPSTVPPPAFIECCKTSGVALPSNVESVCELA